MQILTKAASQPASRAKHIPHCRQPKRVERLPIGPAHESWFRTNLAARRACVQSPAADAAYDAIIFDERKAWPTLTVLERDLRKAFRAAGLYITTDPRVHTALALIIALREWALLSDVEPMTFASEKEYDDEGEGLTKLVFEEPDARHRIEPSIDYIKAHIGTDGWWRQLSMWEYRFRQGGTWKRPTETGLEKRSFPRVNPNNAAPDVLPDLGVDLASFECRLIKRLDFERLRAKLGTDNCRVLDLAISSATMIEIGIDLDLSPEYSRRNGAKLQIKKSLDKLSKLIFEKHPLFSELCA